MKQGPPQTPPTPEAEPILTFEEFSYRSPKDPVPHYNNFFLYFNAGWVEDEVHKRKVHYIKFLSENPAMAASLCDKIQNKRDKSLLVSESLKPFDKDLYEAYKIMRSYGVSDEELFA